MSFKTTYVLFGLLFGVLAVFLITQLFGNRSVDQRTYVLPSMHDVASPVRTADIDRIEIERAKPKPEKIELYRDAHNVWRMKDPNTRADDSLVNRIIDQVMQAKRNQDADMKPDLAAYGLDSPSELVKFYKKDSDKPWTISTGATSAGESTAVVYVVTSDSPKDPMAVRKTELDTLTKPKDEYRSKTLLADSSFDIQSVKFEQPKHEVVSLEKDKENHWKFDRPAWGEADYEGESTPAGEQATNKRISGVRDVLQTVADLRVANDKDFGPTGVDDAKLAELGLEKGKEKLEIEVKRQPSSFSADGDKKEPIADTLIIGKKADDKGESLWARLASEHNVVKVPAKKVDEIIQIVDNPSILRNHDLVTFDTGKVDAIDLQPQGGAPIKLRHTGNPASWKIYQDGKSEAADDNTVQSLLTALTAKRQIKDFPSSAKSDVELGLNKPSSIVSVWVEGLKKEEEKKEASKEEKPKEAEKSKQGSKEKSNRDGAKDTGAHIHVGSPDDLAGKDKSKKEELKKLAEVEPALKDPNKPTVVLAFGKKDKNIVYVRREADKDSARLSIPASLLDKVTEGRLAYLEHKLPPLAPNIEITKVSLSRPGENYVIEKAKDNKTDVWKFAEPKKLAGHNADAGKVDRLLDELRNLQVEKLVAEQPSESDLERFGLKKPADKAVVTVTKPDKKTEELVYEFGKEGSDKSSVYARTNQHGVVFLTAKSALETVEEDLQDRAVLPFESAKVKALKVVGWQDIIGNPFEIDLQKSGKEWQATVPKDYKVDQLAVNAFLAGLSHMKAERFLGRTPKPEYKLDVKDGALQLTFTVEGEKKPITLTVGAPTGNGYYAACSTLPGEFLVVPRGPFESARARPAYFKHQ
jgi:hypothetical protein